MQYNDGILAATLNGKNGWEEICSGSTMVRRHLVRGYKDRIYFAMISESTEKVFELSLSSAPEELTNREVYQHVGGKIVALEPDCENIMDDTNEKSVITQAFYLMDENQKILHIVEEDTGKFKVKEVIDFSLHVKRRDFARLRDQDWSHVHITKRALTFDGVIYNLKTGLTFKMGLPKTYFGEREENVFPGSNDTSSENWKI